MAMKETIKTGRKYRKCIDNTSGNKKWERYSFWSKASDVEFNDGTTAENKLGGFKGVTTNENQVAGYAADVTLVKSIKTALSNLITSLTNLVNSINDRLGGMRFYEDSTGKYVVGADSVPKKLGNPYEVIKICLTDKPGEWFVGDTTGYEVVKASSYNLGIYSEVYIQTDDMSAAKYGAPGGGNPTVWREGMRPTYNASTGVISANYGGYCYLGGGNVCKMTILYRNE